jgi:hypothetical protein
MEGVKRGDEKSLKKNCHLVCELRYNLRNLRDLISLVPLEKKMDLSSGWGSGPEKEETTKE